MPRGRPGASVVCAGALRDIRETSHSCRDRTSETRRCPGV
ncbi:hypothetical protein ET445_07945 [Agromyces protaetiae]|uniref:Syntaxin-5 N-terminal Sly1p-binding domain-containing protein n=1 Tax=Agromyces protaetiae TaxID=2509455 RepID=A0A4P6FBR6_9MICO|nr:hypothetical protein ET445_07945 [Agromyces protaetiae]